jgi:hypothetical protein
MPTITTRGAMSARGFGFGYKAASTNYIAYDAGAGPAGTYVSANGSVLDSSNNFYYVARYYYAGVGGIYVQKQNNLGVSTWYAGFDGNVLSNCCITIYSNGSCIDVDGSGNVYAGGIVVQSSISYAHLAKYNSSGTLQWQRKIYYSGGTGYDVTCVSGLKYDPVSGNICVGVQLDTQTYCLMKYDNTGTLLWKYKITGLFTQNYDGLRFNGATNNMALDSSGNIYICSVTTVSTQGDRLGFIKFDSNGNILQERRYGSTSSSSYGGFGICLDSSNNIYVGGSQTVSGYAQAMINKYDSTGTFQWSNIVYQSATAIIANAIVCDSSNNVYVTGGLSVGSIGNGPVIILKYDTSGTLQYQRTLSSSTITFYGTSIIMGSGNSFYVTTNLQGVGQSVIANLPRDGSKTGSYTVNGVTYSYSAGSYSTGTTSLTDSAGTRSTVFANVTDSAATITTNSVATTNYVTVI